jgi:hypothetical protein
MRNYIKKYGDPLLVIGETNTVHTRMAYRLLNSPYICPYVVGHWGDRFYFEYSMYYQWDLCKKNYYNFSNFDIDKKINSIVKDRLKLILKDKIQPEDTIRFLAANQNSILKKINLTKVKDLLKRNLLKLAHKTDASDPRDLPFYKDNLLLSFCRNIIQVYRNIYLNFISKLNISSYNFGCFFLHMEPEITVEGLAFETKDQAATANLIAAALPIGMKLLVKEHPAMKGKRPTLFYKKLLKTSNIIIVNDSVSSYDILNHAKILFTLTGSVSLESIFVGKPVVILGEIFHKNFKGVNHIDNIQNLKHKVNEVLNSTTLSANREDAFKTLWSMYVSSYKGKIGSQYSYEEMSTSENLELIAKAFKKEFLDKV